MKKNTLVYNQKDKQEMIFLTTVRIPFIINKYRVGVVKVGLQF